MGNCGNCCSRLIWELKKAIYIASTDYEVLEQDSIQHKGITYNESSTINNSNVISRHYQYPDGGAYRSNSITVGKVDAEELPIDVIGVILSFVSESQIFMNIFICNKRLKRHIERESFDCGRHVVFNFYSADSINKRLTSFSNSFRSFKMKYVRHLKIFLGSEFRDYHFKCFPNLESVIIWKGEYIKGTGFKNLKKLRSLRLWTPKNFDGELILKFFGDQLFELEVSDMSSIYESHISKFTKLKSLSLKKCSHIERWSLIFKEAAYYHSLRKLEIVECRVNSDFVPPPKLRVFIAANCRGLRDYHLKSVLEKLESLSLSNCPQIRGEIFHKFQNLRRLVVQRLERLKNGRELFNILTLQDLKINGCEGLTSKSLMISNDDEEEEQKPQKKKEEDEIESNVRFADGDEHLLDGLKKLTLIDQPQIDNDTFLRNSHMSSSLRELKIVQCHQITKSVFTKLKGLVKIEIHGCDNIVAGDFWSV